MSLGFISTINTPSKIPRNNAILNLENLSNMHSEKSPKIGWSYLKVGFSFGCLIGIFLVGVIYIPRNVLVNFEDYNDSIDVLKAMGLRLTNNIVFTMLVWLLPIVFAIFIPLWILELPLFISSILLGSVSLLSLLSHNERINFINMLENVSEIGYMWYEVLLISICAFIVSPSSFLFVIGGPAVSVCCGPTTTNKPFFIFILLALLSIIFVLPTTAEFINDDGEFYLLGYTTDSIFGTLLSISLILIWVKSYHLVCRDCYQTFKQSEKIYEKIFSIFWVLLGTALVEIWVSSAFALHLAYTSKLKLNREKSIFEFKFWKKMSSCIMKHVSKHYLGSIVVKMLARLTP